MEPSGPASKAAALRRRLKDQIRHPYITGQGIAEQGPSGKEAPPSGQERPAAESPLPAAESRPAEGPPAPDACA